MVPELAKVTTELMDGRCEQCGKKRGPRTRRFCSRSCGQKYNRLQNNEAKLLAEVDGPVFDEPPDYHQYVATPWPMMINRGATTRAHAAVAAGVEKSQITRWQKVWEREVLSAQSQVEVDVDDPETLAPRWFGERMGGVGTVTDTELAGLVDAFVAFRDLVFRTDRNKLFLTKEFHRRWILALLSALATGGRVVILSPPRHGKTELLVHFCVWLIVMNPNIRIMWVGGNTDIAKMALGAVKEHLAHNHTLRRYYMPEGTDWVPRTSSGRNWAQESFTVGNRTVTGIRSATMLALGRRGKILSRDADLIVGDDIEDQMSTQHPSEREQTRIWGITQLSSRKEDHTALAWIGSRQHEDDFYHHLLAIDTYDQIVEEAHDRQCKKPENAGNEEHQDCVLFPEKNPYEWLMEKKYEAEAMGQPHLYSMVYLNSVHGVGGATFPPELIESCYDPTSVMGIWPHGEGYTLVAGLDPAHTGYQAAFLWAVKFNDKDGSPHLIMVDTDNTPGGGALKALQQIRNWYEFYRCRHWVIEHNLLVGGIRKDPRIVKYAEANQITLDKHRTGREKLNDSYGVTSMANMMKLGQISLPVGDEESKRKVNAYERQLIDFGGRAGRPGQAKHFKSDLVMASWFPIPRIKSVADELRYQTHTNYRASYQDVPWGSQTSAPWGRETAAPWT